MINVDVPEPIGTENTIGPFTFSQVIRILFYSFPLILLTVYVSFIFLILLFIPVILVWEKYNQNDLDIFLARALVWNFIPKKSERSGIIDRMNFKTASRNATVWEYYEGYMCALEVSGVSIEFLEENEKNNLYQQFCRMLNSLDFGISIYVYSYKKKRNYNFNISNNYLKKVADAQKNLLNQYEEKVYRKKMIIVVSYKYADRKIKSSDDRDKKIELLNERMQMLMKSFESMNLRVKILKFYEYGEIFNNLW